MPSFHLPPEIMGVMRNQTLDELTLVERAASSLQSSYDKRRWIDLPAGQREWFTALLVSAFIVDDVDDSARIELSELADRAANPQGGPVIHVPR